MNDLRAMPEEVRDVFGFALFNVQQGHRPQNATPLRGFTGASVLEIKDDFDGDTYRCVYTVRFARAIYVLHAFQKKSKSGIKTSRTDIDMVKTRLAWAEAHYKANYGVETEGNKP